MKQEKIKNIILISMVLVCIYLSSNVWLKLPDILEYNAEAENKNNVGKAYDIWNVVRPVKNVIKYNENYTITYSDEQDLWGKTVHVIDDAFNDFNNLNVNESAPFPAQYLKFDFNANIPVEIFTNHMEIENTNIKSRIKDVKNVIIDLENINSIYIYNGENTVKIEGSTIDTQDITNVVKKIDFSRETQYAFNQKIGDKTIQVPVPLEKTAQNPVLVESELDVFDTERINEIAKDYFKNNYDYVRKSVEVSGNLVYMYRTEKILKINSEGLLDFYDTTEELENSSDVYESLVTAVNFTEEFLGFPEDGYLNNIESIEYDGSFGYRYTFSYKLLERPILFSKVRENLALQIDVVDKNVISYKRFIRKIDESQSGKMNETEILPVMEVIERNLGNSSSVPSPGEIPELKPLKAEMLEEISNIYLGYFDLSRISREQVLRVVWVVEVKEKSYIFNAITGALIEEW